MESAPMVCAMDTRRPMSRLIEGTISLFGAEEAVRDKSKKRALRLLEFLGMTPEEFSGEGRGVSKEASERMVEAASKKYEDEVKKWFLHEVEGMVPVGYFEEENLDKQPWLRSFLDRLYLTLKDSAKFALKNALSDLAKEAHIEGATPESIYISDDQAEEAMPDLLSFVKSNKDQIAERLGENIQKYLRPGLSADPELRRPERQFAETFFRPRVDQEIYKNYEKYLHDHEGEEKYAELLSKIKEKGRTPKEGGHFLLPDDIGIKMGKVDPYAVDFLSKQKKIRMQIHDRRQVQDSKEKVATWSVTFSIPELASKYPTIYKTALFTMRLPEEVQPPQFTEVEEKAGEDYLDLDVTGSTPKKGVTIRFADTYFDYSRTGAGAIRQFGFGTPDIAKRFINVITSNFKDYLFADVFERDIDVAIGKLGGSVAIRGKGNLFPGGRFEEMGEYGGGSPGVRDVVKERTQEEARGEIDWQRSEAAEKIQAVVETYGSEIVQKYLVSMEPDEAEGMKRAVVSEFEPMIAVVKKGKLGKAISYKDLLETKEIIGEILTFIFDPDLKDVESEWGMHIRDLMTSSAVTRIPGFMDAVKIELYRQKLMPEMKNNPTKVSQKILATPLSEIRESVGDEDVLAYLRSMKSTEKYTFDLRKKLQDTIKGLGKESHPAFKMFFQRLQAWHAYLKPQLIKFLTDATLGKANTDFIRDELLKGKMTKLLDDKTAQIFKDKKDRRKALDSELRKAKKQKDTGKEQELKSQIETEFSAPVFDPDSEQGSKFLDFLRDAFMSDKVRLKTVRTASEEMNLAMIKIMMVKMARTEEHIEHA